MKRYIIFPLLFICSGVFSQISLHTSMLKVCDYNSEKEEYENCEMYDDMGLFSITESYTIITQITSRGKIVYFVNRSYEENDGDDYYFEAVTSEGSNVVFRLTLSSKTFQLYFKSIKIQSIVYYIDNAF